MACGDARAALQERRASPAPTTLAQAQAQQAVDMQNLAALQQLAQNGVRPARAACARGLRARRGPAARLCCAAAPGPGAGARGAGRRTCCAWCAVGRRGVARMHLPCARVPGWLRHQQRKELLGPLPGMAEARVELAGCSATHWPARFVISMREPKRAAAGALARAASATPPPHSHTPPLPPHTPPVPGGGPGGMGGPPGGAHAQALAANAAAMAAAAASGMGMPPVHPGALNGGVVNTLEYQARARRGAPC